MVGGDEQNTTSPAADRYGATQRGAKSAKGSEMTQRTHRADQEQISVNETLTERVKTLALSLGADLVGIAHASSFEEAPRGHRPEMREIPFAAVVQVPASTPEPPEDAAVRELRDRSRRELEMLPKLLRRDLSQCSPPVSSPTPSDSVLARYDPLFGL